MKVLVIDNYDSFTFNLVHYIKEERSVKQLDVFRNDKISLEAIGNYDKIILSPGPGIPSEAGDGIMMKVVSEYESSKSILGVCLGHQAIAEAYGGKLINMPEVMHGISTPINIQNTTEYIYRNLPERVDVGRYHSWCVANENFPSCLEITGQDESGQIMSFSHKTYDIKGVQYHPESILTPKGNSIIKEFINH